MFLPCKESSDLFGLDGVAQHNQPRTDVDAEALTAGLVDGVQQVAGVYRRVAAGEVVTGRDGAPAGLCQLYRRTSVVPPQPVSNR